MSTKDASARQAGWGGKKTSGNGRMKPIAIGLAVSLALAGAAAAAPAPAVRIADAQPGAVRVLVLNAIRGPLEAVLPQAQQAVGKPVVVQWGGARSSLRDLVLSGQAYEVMISLPDVNAEMQQRGLAAPGEVELARVNVAIGLRGEAPGLDVSTPAALKAAMLGARSIKYAPTGAAVTTVRKVISTLGVEGAIRDTSAQSGAVPLGPGEYELNFFPLSEIMANRALTSLGPVMPELQVPVVISAVVGSRANDPAAARALVAFLQGPAIDGPLVDGGMMKGVVAGP
jgi:molybdate transport system substrate-binding protein